MKTVEMIELIELISHVQGILSVLDPDDTYCGQMELERVIQELKKQVERNGFIQG